MSIDPRIVSQWLRLQISPTAGSLGASNADRTPAQGPDFAELLELLTAQGGNDSTLAGHEAHEAHSVPLEIMKYGAMPISIRDVAAKPQEKEEFDSLIEAAGVKYGVDASLIKAVIEVESGYDAAAISHAGAKGLMQLMDETARSLGVTDPFNPLQNIDGGARYLSYLLTKYNGSKNVALAAYNAGPGRVDRLGIRTDADLAAKLSLLPQETQAYIRKVAEVR